MGLVKDHLERLLAQSNEFLWEEGGYVNLLKTLESVFQSPKHWILEFLQNAEDAHGENEKIIQPIRFAIHFGEDNIWILNDGKVFDEPDLRAVCAVKSRKLPSLGFRGYIGIGFKSIFHIADEVDVHSGDYHFKFKRDDWKEYCAQKKIPLSQWPWEILPIEIAPTPLPNGFTTGFHVPLTKQKGTAALQELGAFFNGNDFPKESILLLQHVKQIEIQTLDTRYLITSDCDSREELDDKVTKEVRRVKKQNPNRPRASEDTCYLVIRKEVCVPEDVREDEETERVRRSEVPKREIGMVFGLTAKGELERLYGKLAGVYSFLPVEGEQTGLPFGIFGDFIPQPGRDLINYGARWNQWMSTELVTLFKEITPTVFSKEWASFPSTILSETQFEKNVGPGTRFWSTSLREPIHLFLQNEPVHLDFAGNKRLLDQLVSPDRSLLEVLDIEIIEELTGKHVPSSLVQGVGLPVQQLTVYDLLRDGNVVNKLRNSPAILAKLYGLIDRRDDRYRGSRNIPLSQIPFVLGADDQPHCPEESVVIDLNVGDLPSFLRALVPQGKTLLHPVIAADEKAVTGLKQCSLEALDSASILEKLERVLKRVRSKDDMPLDWIYPDTFIEASLFLLAQKDTASLDTFCSAGGTLEAVQNLFVPGSILDWSPVFEANLLPGFYPIHPEYLDTTLLHRHGLDLPRLYNNLKHQGMHGFDPEHDRQRIQETGENLAKARLENGEGHKLKPVTNRDRLGFDFECESHCQKVFEVKGMVEPHDVELPASEVEAARQRRANYVLIFVYNLPAPPHKISWKAITDPASVDGLLEPIERARVRKDKWLN
ncbi:MAG: DUF3883 domain-containing protein [Chloroflexi bacterium]|nr:DUF3883 domain-containing protein [Chloroflexota bacterium]